MGVWEQFPYTNLHSLNLDWIINQVNDFKTKLDDLVAWAEQHKGEYAELKRRVDVLENEINTFEAKVQAEFDKLEADLQKQFTDLKAEIEKELEDTKAEILSEFTQAMAEFRAEFIALKTAVQEAIREMQSEIQREIIYLESLMEANNKHILDVVNLKLEEFLENLPDYEDLIVYNPVTSSYTNVQQAIFDLYSYFCIYGLTAEQYDSLRLTASEYDNKKLTANEYDQRAYLLLNYPDPLYTMRDPFWGTIVRDSVVIYKLADLHRECLTAEEYDSLQLDAEVYDAMELTAYFYDWYGIRLFDASITASEYDALELEAVTYDLKRLQAIQYDLFGKELLTA